jgi:hypothetical protein
MTPNVFTSDRDLFKVRLPLMRGRHDAERFHASGRAGHRGAPAFDEGGHMMPNVFTPDGGLDILVRLPSTRTAT